MPLLCYTSRNRAFFVTHTRRKSQVDSDCPLFFVWSRWIIMITSWHTVQVVSPRALAAGLLRPWGLGVTWVSSAGASCRSEQWWPAPGLQLDLQLLRDPETEQSVVSGQQRQRGPAPSSPSPASLCPRPASGLRDVSPPPAILRGHHCSLRSASLPSA